NAVGGHAVVPCAFRIDDHRRALAADAQAADLRAVTSLFAFRQASFLQLRLERLPGSQACLRRAATRAGAEKHVPMVRADAELAGSGLQLLLHVGHVILPSHSLAAASHSGRARRRSTRWT